MRQRSRSIRQPDKWMRGVMDKLSYDFHIHSCLSPCADDDMLPSNIVGMAVVAGLNAIALTDHNSCLHCRTAMKLGEEYGILVVPGMELCTREEVHVLCLFPEVEAAEEFGMLVEENMVHIPNQPKFFGNQLIYNELDELAGIKEELLLTASGYSFDELYDVLLTYQAVMVPAHIDKQSNSLIYQMGFVPENSRFSCFELKDMGYLHEFRRRCPYLENCNVISDSDAHQLGSIHGPDHEIFVRERSVTGILDALRRGI